MVQIHSRNLLKEKLMEMRAPLQHDDDCDENDRCAACLTLVSINFMKHHVKRALFFQRLIWIYNLDIDASVGCPCEEGPLQVLLCLSDK